MKKGSPNNAAGAHRPTFPPIDPRLCYPWRRLADWGFGSRGIAALQKAGLSALRFHKQKFFLGSALIAVLKNDSGATNDKEKPGKGGDLAGQKGKSL
ncbi:MAG: hypothetical protein KKA28_17835 [Planctomycetes bacterium]|nr:hypothetical protein [Planctomycetota bacterium]MCG2685392.1 hypothetical protein [Planctomycetales bacterium]